MPGFEYFDEEEKKQLEEVMDSGILMRYNFDAMRNGNWKAKEFEQALQTQFHIKHAHLTSSGTTALITAIRALGAGAGDEIIMPVFTFVASFEAILFTGAIPVLVDIDESLTISPEAIEKAISPRTKIIMPVHMCGAMADMDSIMKIAEKHNLWVLEDACQAIGATYKNQYAGTIGDIGCYSFDFVKTVTCGEGGAVVTNQNQFYEFSHQFSDHGHDHLGNDRGAEFHPVVGLNFRISELQAAIGLAQFQKLDFILEKQRRIKLRLKEIISENKNVRFRKVFDEKGDNASFLSLILNENQNAKEICNLMKQAGIPCLYWFDNNWHYIRKWNHFKNLKNATWLYEEQRDLLPDYENQDFSNSDDILSRTISIPVSLKWDDEKTENTGREIVKILNLLN
jgi:8-amino-3,8-dideoxy-alpha-D-manno-octulosonate transaminase